MKNVNELLVVWTKEEDVSFEDTKEIVTLVKEKGLKVVGDPTGISPAVLKFELADKGISIYGLVSLARKIENEGKYEVHRVEFDTLYDEWYDEGPSAVINLLRKENEN